MKILMPDEAGKKNIITKRELRAILTALMPYGRVNSSQAQIKAMESAAIKIQRVLDGMKG